MGKKSLAEKKEKEARDSRLRQAIANDNVNLLHDLIMEEPELLDRASKHPFPNTSLHLAAATGKTQVAMEIAILKPSFARKLNPEGYSPMHLALQQGHYHTVRALTILDPKLIRVRGRCGVTPLHYVAGKIRNEPKLLTEFLCACKSSIEDLTTQYETAVHLAVKNKNLNAFKDLFEWLKQVRQTEILGWMDQDDKTVLDIARIEPPQHEVIELLSTIYNVANVPETPPMRGRGARYFLEFLSWKVKSALNALEKRAIIAFRKCARFFRVQNEATREVILVVSTLIVAATYQATLTPPVGYWQGSSSNPSANSTIVTAKSSSIAPGKPHQAGDIILGGWRLYLYFICNSMAFYASIATILATTLPLEATSIVYVSIPFLCTAYFISLSIQIPIPNAAAVISTGVLFELSLLAVVWLLLYMKIKHRKVQPINPTMRRLPTFRRSKD